ncbi:hypothetical protein [Luteolibacter sp. LG18]|uniref:hypothetical protein n=1 Tax=Luteolibacter sp. LG18 TaxID=2819286 RepID=UPI002B2A81A4|nr:hypothetical protein llg_15660 [Luteolibacter sp. LG18]
MSRKEWKEAVEAGLAEICKLSGFTLAWKTNSPVAVLMKNGLKVEVTANGVWFMGTEKRQLDTVMEDLRSPDGAFRGDPCNLGLLEPYRQPSGRLAVICEVPTEAKRLGGFVNALDGILVEIASAGSLHATAAAPSFTRRRTGITFHLRCELAVVVSEAIVRHGMQGQSNPQLTGRVFGIADFAPIVGESGLYRSELKTRSDSKSRGEHIVPCKVVSEILLSSTFHDSLSVDARVEELKRLLKIVYISGSEQATLDRKFGLKDRMPGGPPWPTGCIYSRLTAAGVSKVFMLPIASNPPPPCGCGGCGM